MGEKMKEAPIQRGVLPGDQQEQTREAGALEGWGGGSAGEGRPHRGTRSIPVDMHLLPEHKLSSKCCKC